MVMQGKWIGFCGSVFVLFIFFPLFSFAAALEMPPDIKACEIVTGEEVAELAGAKLLTKPNLTSFFCFYVVEQESGAAENYNLTFDSASSTELLLNHMSAEEKGEKIEGILDEAYIGKKLLGGQIALRALRRGKLGMIVTGDRKDVILKIGRLAITRLP
jgi:hypothetical protein